MSYEFPRWTYYVSQPNIGKVSIINGENNEIIREIEVGVRPQNIIVDEKNNIYIASDKDNRITIINDEEYKSKNMTICNNGNIEVDSYEKKLFVSNTSEIYIYDLESGEKLNTLKGFMAATCMQIDRENKRLFILDILQHEIKVYNTSDLQYVTKYKNFGFNSSCFVLNKLKNEIYIANKRTYTGTSNSNIAILPLHARDISQIHFPQNSIITELKCRGDFLYAINHGLQRIEVIDLLKRKSVSSISTSFSVPKRICITPDQQTLLATSTNFEGRGAIDIINLSTNTIINSIFYKQVNSAPFDIGIVVKDKRESVLNEYDCCDSEIYNKKDNKIYVLSNSVVSTYQEKMVFEEVIYILPNNLHNGINVKSIVFQKCVIERETELREVLSSRKDYSIINYDFYIPYYVDIVDQKGVNQICYGNLCGKQSATVYIPYNIEQKEIKVVANSNTRVINTPIIENGMLKFAASTLISTKVMVEELICIPNCNTCRLRNVEKGGV